MSTDETKRKKWPTMKPIEIKPRVEVGFVVEATVNLNGRPVVNIHRFDPMVEDETYFPDEAERIARALLKAATVCRAKRAAAKATP